MISLGNPLIALTLAAATLLSPAHARTKAVAGAPPSRDIVWGEQITLVPPDGAMGRYPRLVKITSGPHADDLLQENPFGRDLSLYSFIEPISDSEILVGAGPVDGDDKFIYLRFGTLQP